MAIDPDALLLDRVFQPLCDAAAGWASPFGLARGALVLAVESEALTLFWNTLADPSGPSVAISGFAGALTLFGAVQAWAMIARTERQSRGATMNVRRITMRGQRMTWLGVGAGCVGVLAPQGNIRAAFAALSCLAWIALIYFVSCTPRPPVRLRSGRLVPATVPVAS